MKIPVLAAGLSGLLLFGASNARAHDEGCEYQDGVTAVDRGYGADVVHYDHHHYYQDEDGNPYVVHHDHHYVSPNEDYGYRPSYYQQPSYRQGYDDGGHRQVFRRAHRGHRAALRFFFGG
ncbi:MAG: hypothetical protein ACR2HH_05395 [Chthoniobacterales bacterium]